MAIGHKDIRPAIIVKIKEAGAPKPTLSRIHSDA